MQLVVPPGGSFRETRRIELGARPFTIGRSEKCEVRVDVPGVDDEHATITLEALTAIGPDCAIGDVPMDAGVRRLIQAGDEIMIGSVVLGLEGMPRRNGPSNAPRIRVVEGEATGNEVFLEQEGREYIIGRSKTADLVLKDREVSREHLKVTRRGYGIHVYDAASTRGSWLGRSAVYQGSTIEWQRPRMLKVGATVLALELPIEAGPVPLPVASAPHSVQARPQIQTFSPSPDALAAGPPTNVGVFHYEAKPQNEGAILASVPPPRQSIPPAAGSMGSMPPPSSSSAALGPSMTSIPPLAPTSRAGWKKEGATISRGSGLILLALGGIVILGVIFGVFFLLE